MDTKHTDTTLSSSAASATPAAPVVRLDHASIITTSLTDAIRFYVDLLGLRLRVVEDDPIRPGRRRAMLVDQDARDVVEIIEMPELAHPTIPGRGGIHHIGFRLPTRAWHTFRSRLDAARYPYQEVQGRLFVRDADGLVLEIEHPV
jgi:glyoxylase I family protein